MRDRLGNEMFRKQDAQGRPLKLVSQPFFSIEQARWDLAMGKITLEEYEQQTKPDYSSMTDAEAGRTLKRRMRG